MAGNWRAIRRRLITPSKTSASFAKRGFYEKNPETRKYLETVGGMFIDGYAYAVESRSIAEMEARIDQLPRQFRGFAYEGAGMGHAMLDGMFGGRHVEKFLASRAESHVYMVYVGVGWALARLPRFRWAAATKSIPDPLLRWLVLDGYGFHQAFFKTEKYVHQQYQEKNFPWPTEGPRWYTNNALDQGIGRAMWFVGGAEPNRVADLIGKFPQARHADLYAGAGLAASYAGSVSEEELRTFASRAGVYLPQVAQGSVFAATARVETNLVTEHTPLATRILAGITPEQAQVLQRQVRPAPADRPEGDIPIFELWRQRISAGVTAMQGANP
ncbi:MAG TPA: DUF1702 family protein [Actinocrinis sp.]|uniref:DUF1702 family protein n=1 Tax=Actinocrinis sp. TaxID=1920516 RepID=UPI002DDD3D40|nr:DUF1702 family protein [Actinocrinis sp.]HEV2347669.1 DUF1702 family protein [Actinocrinis sp.]